MDYPELLYPKKEGGGGAVWHLIPSMLKLALSKVLLKASKMISLSMISIPSINSSYKDLKRKSAVSKYKVTLFSLIQFYEKYI